MKFLIILFVVLFGLSCQSETRQKIPQSAGFDQTDQNQSQEKKPYRKHRNRPEQFRNDQQTAPHSGTVPAKVYDVLAYVRQNGQPQNGYVGGRRFGNFENNLPRQDVSGRRIGYQEWDVNPKQKGRNRGIERLITGSDGRAWFTSDHYNTFTEVKN